MKNPNRNSQQHNTNMSYIWALISSVGQVNHPACHNHTLCAALWVRGRRPSSFHHHRKMAKEELWLRFGLILNVMQKAALSLTRPSVIPLFRSTELKPFR